MSFSVLFVCTGNICRSPLAERVLRSRVGGDGRIVTGSAGTSGMVGCPMDEVAASVLRELGGDPDGHAGRRLSEGLVAGADLILGAEAVHRSAVLQLEPLAFRRTFTLREFARLGSDLLRPSRPLGLEEMVERVSEVAGRRGWVSAVDPGADDIADPIGMPLAGMRVIAGQVAEAVEALVGILGVSQLENRQLG